MFTSNANFKVDSHSLITVFANVHHGLWIQGSLKREEPGMRLCQGQGQPEGYLWGDWKEAGEEDTGPAAEPTPPTLVGADFWERSHMFSAEAHSATVPHPSDS